ncbi:MAG: ABC transporter substrate-binding protein [Alphaproteobacteria bacterium]|nr:ABC transporter substrate-binding protein [Alphaproteobacteria bacterium]
MRLRLLPFALGMLVTASASAAEPTVLRVMPQGPLTGIDPIATPGYPTLDHAYLVYDTLFALDAGLRARPQMANGDAASADGLSHRIALRPGLRWHDGTTVTAADCIASIRRWAARDGLGRDLMDRVARLEPDGDDAIAITLTRPFPLLVEALAKPMGTVPFMMPARLARLPADRPVDDATGSGPFRFAPTQAEGNFRKAYERNAAYVPRPEPLSLFAGGKRAAVDRLEWLYIPVEAIATFELYAGTVHYWRAPPAEALPRLAGNPDVTIRASDPLGETAMLRLNHRSAPFDDQRVRQAAALAIDHQAMVAALGGLASAARVCVSMLPCGLPDGPAALADPRPAEERRAAARRLLREAAYDGKPLILLTAHDQPLVDALARNAADQLRRVGFAVTINDMLWPDLVRRRQSPASVEDGGWSAFVTRWPALDLASPAWNEALRATGAQAWTGWPQDEALEKLRQDWLDAPSAEGIARIERRAAETVPYVPLVQFNLPVAYRHTAITDPPPAPVMALWGVERR